MWLFVVFETEGWILYAGIELFVFIGWDTGVGLGIVPIGILELLLGCDWGKFEAFEEEFIPELLVKLWGLLGWNVFSSFWFIGCWLEEGIWLLGKLFDDVVLLDYAKLLFKFVWGTTTGAGLAYVF